MRTCRNLGNIWPIDSCWNPLYTNKRRSSNYRSHWHQCQILKLFFCCYSVIKSCPTLCDLMDCSTPGFCPSSSPRVTQSHVYWVSDAIQPFHPVLFPSPAFNLSYHQGLFQWVKSSHQGPKYWSFNYSINPSNEYSGLISFRIAWFDH